MTKPKRQRTIKVLAALLLVPVLLGLFPGCGDNAGNDGQGTPAENVGSQGKDEPPAENGDKDNAKAGFPASVTLGGVVMTMGADAAPVLASLGEAKNYVAKESCAFVGQDKEYTYGGFVLMTYPDGDTDRISSVILTSDAVTTGEGLYIGAPESEIEKALGSDCTKESGSYLYRGEDAQLLILASDGKITSIQYSAVFES